MNENIRALYTDKTVRVYQAFNATIANEAIKIRTFGNSFKIDRMTWIKPSFLWMMYRCGWGTKENQEHILAIDIKREKFDFAVKNSVLSEYKESVYDNHDKWKELIHNSDIRCQWDPERDIFGNALDYRSIQIGLRRQAIIEYVNSWIVDLTDITESVNELYEMRNAGQDITKLLPRESLYQLDN